MPFREFEPGSFPLGVMGRMNDVDNFVYCSRLDHMFSYWGVTAWISFTDREYGNLM